MLLHASLAAARCAALLPLCRKAHAHTKRTRHGERGKRKAKVGRTTPGGLVYLLSVLPLFAVVSSLAFPRTHNCVAAADSALYPSTPLPTASTRSPLPAPAIWALPSPPFYPRPLDGAALESCVRSGSSVFRLLVLAHHVVSPDPAAHAAPTGPVSSGSGGSGRRKPSRPSPFGSSPPLHQLLPWPTAGWCFFVYPEFLHTPNFPRAVC